jgi:hypothetical protein
VPLQHQVLAAGRISVDARALGHVADGAADCVGLAHDVVTRDLAATAIRACQRRAHLDGRRLAGPVRPEEREDLPGPDAEGHPREGLHIPVPLL